MVERLQSVFVDIDAVDDHVGRQPCIGDVAGFGQHEIIRIGIKIGAKVGIGGVRNRGFERINGQGGENEITPFTDEIEQGLHVSVGGLQPTGHSTLYQRAGDFRAQRIFEFLFGLAVAFQGKAIGFAVEIAVQPLEGRDAKNLSARLFIARRKAKFVGLVFQGNCGDELL